MLNFMITIVAFLNLNAVVEGDLVTCHDCSHFVFTSDDSSLSDLLQSASTYDSNCMKGARDYIQNTTKECFGVCYYEFGTARLFYSSIILHVEIYARGCSSYDSHAAVNDTCIPVTIESALQKHLPGSFLLSEDLTGCYCDDDLCNDGTIFNTLAPQSSTTPTDVEVLGTARPPVICHECVYLEMTSRDSSINAKLEAINTYDYNCKKTEEGYVQNKTVICNGECFYEYGTARLSYYRHTINLELVERGCSNYDARASVRDTCMPVTIEHLIEKWPLGYTLRSEDVTGCYCDDDLCNDGRLFSGYTRPATITTTTTGRNTPAANSRETSDSAGLICDMCTLGMTLLFCELMLFIRQM